MALPRRGRTAIVVAVREVYEHAWNPIVWFMVLVATMFTVFATRVGVERLVIAEGQYQSLVEQRARDRQKTNGALLGSDVETGLRAIRAPEPLSLLTAGDGPMARFWDFSPSGIRAGRVPEPIVAESGTAGFLDLELVVRVLVGLLAISLAVETIAGERESGALLALLGQPVQARHVLAGKLIGGTITLGLVIGVTIVAALTTTALTHPRFVTSEAIVSLFGLWILGTLYAFVCFAAGMLMSMGLRLYRHALIGAFVAWTMAALVAPPGMAVIVQVITPSRHPAVMEAERARVMEAATSEAERRMGSEYARLLGGAAEWASHRDDVPLTRQAQARVEPIWTDAVIRARGQLETVRRAFDADRRRQRWITWILGLPNPAAAFAKGAANLSGTGDRALDRWESTLTAYQRSLEERLFDDRPNLRALVPYVNPREPGTERRLVVLLERHQPPTVSSMGGFTEPAQTATRRLLDTAPQATMLTIQALLLVAGSVIAFERLRL
jgi:hypothetical protein